MSSTNITPSRAPFPLLPAGGDGPPITSLPRHPSLSRIHEFLCLRGCDWLLNEQLMALSLSPAATEKNKSAGTKGSQEPGRPISSRPRSADQPAVGKHYSSVVLRRITSPLPYHHLQPPSTLPPGEEILTYWIPPPLPVWNLRYNRSDISRPLAIKSVKKTS